MLADIGDNCMESPAAAIAMLASRTRDAELGGELTALPYSGRESGWVIEVFRSQGLAARQLTGPVATEANLRAGVSNRRLVHLACHGLANTAHGNFFGALALAPGTGPQSPAVAYPSTVTGLNRLVRLMPLGA